jgi:hypothetical protein
MWAWWAWYRIGTGRDVRVVYPRVATSTIGIRKEIIARVVW